MMNSLDECHTESAAAPPAGDLCFWRVSVCVCPPKRQKKKQTNKQTKREKHFQAEKCLSLSLPVSSFSFSLPFPLLLYYYYTILCTCRVLTGVLYLYCFGVSWIQCWDAWTHNRMGKRQRQCFPYQNASSRELAEASPRQEATTAL